MSDAPALGPYALSLGIRPLQEAAGVTLTVGPEHLNFLDVTHGGVVFSVAEAAFELAAGPEAVTVDTHLALTGGSREGQVLTALAEEVTRGRTLGSYRVVVRREDGRVVGLFTATVRIPRAEQDDR